MKRINRGVARGRRGATCSYSRSPGARRRAFHAGEPRRRDRSKSRRCGPAPSRRTSRGCSTRSPSRPALRSRSRPPVTTSPRCSSPDRRRRRARRRDPAAARAAQGLRVARRTEAGRGRGRSAGRPALLAELAHARHRRQHALRRVVQGRQQVDGLVQREGLRRRGREAGEELRRPDEVDADDLRLRRAAALDRRARTAGRSPTRSRTSTCRRPAPTSTTS